MPRGGGAGVVCAVGGAVGGSGGVGKDSSGLCLGVDDLGLPDSNTIATEGGERGCGSGSGCAHGQNNSSSSRCSASEAATSQPTRWRCGRESFQGLAQLK